MKLIAHSLLATAKISGGDIRNQTHIQQVANRLKAAGASGMEVAFHPGLFTAEVGESVRASFPISGLCVFFGEEDPDPLSGVGSEALERLGIAIEWAGRYGDESGEVPQITGPWGFQIGKKYSRTAKLVTDKMVEFIKRVQDIAIRHNVRMNLEYLRPAEGFAIQGPEHCFEIVSQFDPNYINVHEDTFHAALWGTNTADNIIQYGDRIGWLHTSGTNRHSPGHPGDKTDWKKIGNAISDKQWNRPVCFEGFGPEFREAVPAIADGFPPDLPVEGAIPLALHTLTGCRIIS